LNFQKVSLPQGIHLVGVPIGTARDITLRALDVLASADVLAAEDTRSLRRLMEIHGVPLDGRRIHTLHDHSADKVVGQLLARVGEGGSVAYASEAGMPLIADPGFELIRAARGAGVPVHCAPGPSAVVTALAVGGLPTDAFLFGGFLHNAKAARRTALEGWGNVQATLVFYESPKRLAAMLADAADVLGGDRQAAVCRELTKKFEEVRSGTLSELAEHYADAAVKGEIVVLIDRRLEKIREDDIESDLIEALGRMSVRDAVDAVSTAHGAPRRKVYQLALTLPKGDSENS